MPAKTTVVLMMLLLAIVCVNTLNLPQEASNARNQVISDGDVTIVASNKNTNNGEIQENYDIRYYK
ncbi:hypothetical protein KGM_209355 [Danaus plexippus plexippus]|uniref:Uncharacterized protein n=1 Tax=Danaus plexippus plexippus TaxID=278856 RepID=A0A212ET40_DANPL|nr:hypothetical protein KGM_209355 [Danaus plexippus plexippus]